MYTDIGYLSNYQDFTVDLLLWNLTLWQTCFNQSSPNGVNWMPILDAGIFFENYYNNTPWMMSGYNQN